MRGNALLFVCDSCYETYSSDRHQKGSRHPGCRKSPQGRLNKVKKWIPVAARNTQQLQFANAPK